MISKSYEIQKNPSNFLKFNVFLLYGENYGLKKDIKESIKLSLNQTKEKIELISLYENEILESPENFYNFIYSGSLFSNKKIITINGGTDKIYKIIESVLEKYPENSFIIIFSDILEKKSKLRKLFETNKNILSIPCYLDNERDLELIIANELKNNNINLSREMINLLIQKSNNDRNNLKNEIEKIKILMQNKNKINIDELKSIINFSGEIKSDNFVNQCLCGNINQYKKILSEIYNDTINQIYFLRILSNKIQRLLKMKEEEKKFNNLDNLLNSAKPPIFWKEKDIVKQQLTIWKLNDLKSSINDINQTELLCKRNPQIAKIIFFELFNRICKKASNYS